MFFTLRTIQYYTTKSGTTPFIEWINKLDNKTVAIIYKRLERMKLGNFGDHKNLKDGVFELKISFGPGYRIYFGKDGKEIIIILSAGDKKTQNRDIKKAKLYFRRYKNEK